MEVTEVMLALSLVEIIMISFFLQGLAKLKTKAFHFCMPELHHRKDGRFSGKILEEFAGGFSYKFQ